MSNHVEVGLARGWVLRVGQLRGGRKTDGARLVFDAGLGAGGEVELGDDAGADPQVRHVRQRIQLAEARLLLRVDDSRTRRRALQLMEDLTAQLMGDARGASTVASPDRQLLSSLALAFSQAGVEDRAIEITEFLLGLSPGRLRKSVPLSGVVVAGMSASDIRIQIGNTGVRLTNTAYLRILAGTAAAREEGAAILERARMHADLSLLHRVPFDRGGTVSLETHLVGRSQLLMVQIEEAVMQTDLSERLSTLAGLASEAKWLVKVSDSSNVVGAGLLVARSARLGQILVEQARIEAELGDDSAGPTALLAKVCLMPLAARYERDADDSPVIAVRYGDAAWLAGDRALARDVWSRIVRRWEDHPNPLRREASVALRSRLDQGVPRC